VIRGRASVLAARALNLAELPPSRPDERARAEFAALLDAAVARGTEIDYASARPKHEFLQHDETESTPRFLLRLVGDALRRRP
jgi:hypothetical protein